MRSSAWFAASLVLVSVVGTTGCKRHVLPTTRIKVGEHSMLVEVADNGENRARGLMNRDGLPANEGMLFVYPEAEPRGFWMKNVRFPLSIAFAGEDGVIVSISDMKPMSKRSTLSGAPAMYALEVNEGWFLENGVKVGQVLGDLPGPAEH